MTELKSIIANIANLLKVKSLWSLVSMAMFVYLIVTGKISGEIAMATITAIVTYYFTKQSDEKATTESAKTESVTESVNEDEGDIGK